MPAYEVAQNRSRIPVSALFTHTAPDCGKNPMNSSELHQKTFDFLKSLDPEARKRLIEILKTFDPKERAKVLMKIIHRKELKEINAQIEMKKAMRKAMTSARKFCHCKTPDK
ncbi:MAG TPA: hypothetical protein VJ577_01855 [Burkholderiaceae bacterium]|nr:hypothetical protein [Burkholderiaceae bacterium]